MQMQPTTISSGGSSIGDTSLILTSFLGIDGVALTMTDFGSLGFGTLEPSSATNEEQISFTGITQNGNGTATLTGVKTVLFKSPYTQTSGLAKSHAGGIVFVISNTSGFYNRIATKDDDESITGLWNFDPLPQSSETPTDPTDLTTKDYVDNVVISGAPNATTSVQGLVQLPTQAQVDAKTGSGSTGAALSVTPNLVRATKYNDYVADTGSASTYVIAPSPAIVAYATGQQFAFIAATANSAASGASTLAVSGLAATPIKKYLSTALSVNDIKVGQVITVIFDGTNFQMINVVGNGTVDLATAQTISAGIKTFVVLPQSSTAPATGNDFVNKTYSDTFKSGTTTKNVADASTVQNIAHGLGRVPNLVKLTCRGAASTSTHGHAVAEANYNGTTQNSQSVWYNNAFVVDNSFTLNGDETSGGNAGQTGVITFDATNIIITWTKAGVPTGTFQILWEAR